MNKQLFPHIPGLLLYRNFFDGNQCNYLIKNALKVYNQLEQQITSQTSFHEVNIPQPKFVQSAKHNLNSKEHFVSMTFEDRSKRRCEYFPKYGERGHALCYFRGNDNIPDFISEQVICRLKNAINEDGVIAKDHELRWKLTINYYKNIDNKIAGFPFHVDIPSNGVVTMILNVHREGLLQMAKEEDQYDIDLQIGSVLILSGESRYEWKHRVLPQILNEGEVGLENEIKRISLVLGFQ